LGDSVAGPFPPEKFLFAVRKSLVTKEHLISYDGKNSFPAANIWNELAPPGTVIEPAPPMEEQAAPRAPGMPLIKTLPPRAPPQEKPAGPWASIGWGIVLLVAGIGIFLWLNHAEQNGGVVRLPLWLMAIYAFLSKWGVLAILGGLGLFGIFHGVRELLAKTPTS